MERTPHKSYLLCFAGLILAIACSGCGKPMLYHFKHYHRPFAGIAESNQTYFHSQQTGRIIEKDPCGEYCEPGCYGYEPTTWTHWPAQCPGNFPVQGEEAIDAMSYESYGEEAAYSYGESVIGNGVISNGVMLETPVPPSAIVEDANTVPSSQSIPTTQRPSITPLRQLQRGSTIPTDNESAIPSPSDATNNLPLPLPVPKASQSAMQDAVAKSETTKVTGPAVQTVTRLSLEPATKVDSGIQLRMNRPVMTRIGFDGNESTTQSHTAVKTVKTPTKVADKLSKVRFGDSKGPTESPSLSSKLFSVREFEKPTKIQVDKPVEIKTQPLQQAAKKVQKVQVKKAADKLIASKPTKVIPPTNNKLAKKATKLQGPANSPAKKLLANKAVKVNPNDSKQVKDKPIVSKPVVSKPVAKTTVSKAAKSPSARRNPTAPVGLTKKKSALAVNSPSKKAIPLPKKSEPKGSQVVIRDGKSADIAKATSSKSKLSSKKLKSGVMTMKVSDYGNSTVKFSTDPIRKPIRVSAVSDDQPSVRFR